MARKPTGKAPKDKAPPARANPTEFKINFDKANPSPLDFINRRMAEEDGDEPES